MAVARRCGGWLPKQPVLFVTDALGSSSTVTAFEGLNPQINMTLGSGLFNQVGITIDSSRPFQGFLGAGPVRLSGAPLVLGRNIPNPHQIRDLTASRPLWTPNLASVCFGGGLPYVPGIAYSAELTSLGAPCGKDVCALGGASTARGDVFPVPSLNSPGQPLVRVIHDTNPPTCGGTSSTRFRVETCSLTSPTSVTAYLVYMVNQVSTATFPTPGGRCTVSYFPRVLVPF